MFVVAQSASLADLMEWQVLHRVQLVGTLVKAQCISKRLPWILFAPGCGSSLISSCGRSYGVSPSSFVESWSWKLRCHECKFDSQCRFDNSYGGSPLRLVWLVLCGPCNSYGVSPLSVCCLIVVLYLVTSSSYEASSSSYSVGCANVLVFYCQVDLYVKLICYTLDAQFASYVSLPR